MDGNLQKKIDNITFFCYDNFIPKIGNNVFIAPGAKIIGNVEIADNCSVWYNCVIRGDVNFIKIGENTNVQDLSMLHVTSETNPLIIGKNVTIGHSAKLHGCTLRDCCLIGIGAIVLDGALVNSYSLIAAGSVVTPKSIIPEGKMVAGIPAKIIRDLTENEKKELEESANRYNKYSVLSMKSYNKENYGK